MNEYLKELAAKHRHNLFWILPLLIAVGIVIAGTPARFQQKETVLFIAPEGGSFIVGAVIEAAVKIKTAVPINAVEALLSFPPDILEVTRISREGSVLDLWIQEASFNNEQGVVSFVGGVPNPGFNGEGAIFTIFFKAKDEGWAYPAFHNATVLANDGKGTNVLERTEGAAYFVKELPEASVDMNDDGRVTIADIRIFLSLWKNSDPNRMDFNADREVNLKDLGILIASLGKQM